MYTPDPSDSWQEYLSDLNPDGPLLCTDFGDPLPDPSSSYLFDSFFPQETLAPSTTINTKNNFTTSNLSPPPPNDQSSSKQPGFTEVSPSTKSKMRKRESLKVAPRYPFSQCLSSSSSLSNLETLSSTSRAGVVQFNPTMNGNNSHSHVPLSAVYDGGSPYTTNSDSPGTPLSSGSSATPIVATCDLPRRDAHMASEQRRRAIMRESFERLQQLLPPSEYRKPSKANLLQAAVNYIALLKTNERGLRTRIQLLHRENAFISQQMYGSPSSPFTLASIATKQASNNNTYDGMPPLAPSAPSNHRGLRLE